MEGTPTQSAPEVPPQQAPNADAYEQFWASMESDEIGREEVMDDEARDAYGQFWKNAEF